MTSFLSLTAYSITVLKTFLRYKRYRLQITVFENHFLRYIDYWLKDGQCWTMLDNARQC